jgi:hypothetical protein
MNQFRILGCAVVSLALTVFASAQANILPPNNLHLQDNLLGETNVTEEQFNTIIDSILESYQPLAALHGGKIEAYKGWSNSTVNASAQRMGGKWLINMYGGLARRPEVTPDGFAMVVCHELGHHFAGFPFVSGIRGALNGAWAANEGQSDYFATHSCARRIWANDNAKNTTFESQLDETSVGKCNAQWSKQTDKNLCYRVTAAGQSLGNLLAALGDDPFPDFSTPDSTVRRSTMDAHPNAQCRLDTYLAGALCKVSFNEKLIPGRRALGFGQGSKAAEKEALQNSCVPERENNAEARPRCWFAPRQFN